MGLDSFTCCLFALCVHVVCSSPAKGCIDVVSSSSARRVLAHMTFAAGLVFCGVACCSGVGCGVVWWRSGVEWGRVWWACELQDATWQHVWFAVPLPLPLRGYFGSFASSELSSDCTFAYELSSRMVAKARGRTTTHKPTSCKQQIRCHS